MYLQTAEKTRIPPPPERSRLSSCLPRVCLGPPGRSRDFRWNHLPHGHCATPVGVSNQVSLHSLQDPSPSGQGDLRGRLLREGPGPMLRHSSQPLKTDLGARGGDRNPRASWDGDGSEPIFRVLAGQPSGRHLVSASKVWG